MPPKRVRKSVVQREAEVFGRPKDDELQSLFMKLLKIKLPSINSQSVAQLQCSKHDPTKPRNSKPEDIQDRSAEKIAWVKHFFQGRDELYYGLLWGAFVEAINRWQFKEVHTKTDLPPYLFLDECDLSHVLHSILFSLIPELQNKKEFSYEELLFLELLCFASRDMIPMRALRSIGIKFDYIVSKMNGIKEKIVSHYEKSNKTLVDEKNQEGGSKDQFVDFLSWNNDNSDIEMRNYSVFGQRQEEEGEKEEKEEKQEKQGKREKKSKQIGKPKTITKRGGSKNSQDLTQLSLNELEELMNKLNVHITLSYRYIFSEEVKKKERLKQ